MNNSDSTTSFLPTSRPMFRWLPGWRGNLLVFGLLIGVVLIYIFQQVRSTQETFSAYAREHSRMLAGVIEVNARGALLSQASVEKILELFLGNTARFVEYLDGIEPFTEEELAAFARENGLDGVAIRLEDNVSVMGPAGWLDGSEADCRMPSGSLRHIPERHLYVASWSRGDGSGCILVGLTAPEIEELQDRIGLDRLLQTLSGLAGIQYVRLTASGASDSSGSLPIDPEAVEFLEDGGKEVAEVKRLLGDKVLRVGLDAERFTSRVSQLWQEFFVFSALLAGLGCFFSWLLYRYQKTYFRHIQTVERDLAREREDAALGRSAAAIAHEIRNPLNAIGMGLQRLQMEVAGLAPEERSLISALLSAVHRADGIIENLRLYARPLAPVRKRIFLGDLTRELVSLYRQAATSRGIAMTLDIHEDRPIWGDPNLLSQAIENLLKNGIEAQPDGGILALRIDVRDGECCFRMENEGFELDGEDAERILEPYFTTKTKGTGLGLAIVRKTVLAHAGRMDVTVPAPGVLRIVMRFPTYEETDGENHADTHR